MKRKIINNISKILSAILIIGFGGMTLWYAYRIYQYDETNNAQIELYITPISCRAMGYVQEIKCIDNQLVEKGDTLIIIESSQYNLKRDENKAMLDKALAEYDIAIKQIEAKDIEYKLVENQIVVGKIKLEKNSKEFERVKNLLELESITQQQYDNTETDYLLSKKEVEKSKLKLSQTILEKQDAINNSIIAKSKIKNCQTLLAQSDLNISYTYIKAPYCGRIGKIDIQEGQLLQVGQAVTFITNEAAGKWVVANVKETQLKNYTVGKEVTISVDAIPEKEFKGIIESISPATGTRYSLLPPNNATGNFVKITQRVPVRIKLIDAEEYYDILRGGMNAYVSSRK